MRRAYETTAAGLLILAVVLGLFLRVTTSSSWAHDTDTFAHFGWRWEPVNQHLSRYLTDRFGDAERWDRCAVRTGETRWSVHCPNGHVYRWSAE